MKKSSLSAAARPPVLLAVVLIALAKQYMFLDLRWLAVFITLGIFLVFILTAQSRVGAVGNA